MRVLNFELPLQTLRFVSPCDVNEKKFRHSSWGFQSRFRMSPDPVPGYLSQEKTPDPVQGYPAHKKTPLFLRPPQDPRHSPTVGFYGVAVSRYPSRSLRFFDLPTKMDTETCFAEWPCFPWDHIKPPGAKDCSRYLNYQRDLL